MESLGNWLQTARTAKGVSLKEVEEVTRIRVRYLEALEAGEYESMPGGEAQVRGFLRRYASFLGLSADEATTRYMQEVHGEIEAAHLAAPRAAKTSEATTAMSLTAPTGQALWTAFWIAGAVATVVLLALGGWWVATRSGLLSHPTATPIPVATTEMPPTAPPPNTATASQTPQATPTFPVAASGGVTLTLEPLEHVWVRVTADGFTVFEGMIGPDSTQPPWTAEELVVVETGNGAGVIAVVNGQVQGPVGGRGEVCARGWGAEGELEVPPPSIPTPTSEDG